MLDLVGVGIGPSNLSLAALLAPLKQVSSCFFDNKKEFQWHPGMLFSNATIQVSYLKDLVTLVDPTSKYSFLAFLANQKRLYRFATAQFPSVKRREFNQYFQWVSQNLGNLQFDTPIVNIHHDNGRFIVEHPKGVEYANNIVLASGLTVKIPEFVKPYISSTVFHAINYMELKSPIAGKRVAVVGGGQSGAEVIRLILSNKSEIPESITWITSRPNILPIDNTPFVNEYFFPSYSDHFFKLPKEEKARLIKDQNLASDGINVDLLNDIYRELYELELIEGRGKICQFLTNQSFVGFEKNLNGWGLALQDKNTGEMKEVEADVVICATGFEYQPPSYLESLLDRIDVADDNFIFGDDFSVKWDGPKENKIFIQNGARHTRGVSDPNLSLMAWRSAKIINGLLGGEIYDINNESTALDWQNEPEGILAHNGYDHHFDF